MKNQPAAAPNEKPPFWPPPDRMFLTRGYAGKFLTFVIAGLLVLASRDLTDPESSHIVSLFSLHSVGWTWFWLLFGALLTLVIAGFVSFGSYAVRAVNGYKDPEPIDPIEAGIIDVSFWCCLLSYTATLVCAALLPVGPWWLRPPLIVVISVIGASVTSALLMNRVVRAIYGIGKLRETISRRQCDMKSIKGGLCQNWALRSKFRGKVDAEETEFCRWHYIALLTAQRYQARLSAAVFKQVLAAMCLLYGVIGLWSFLGQGGIVWPAISVLAVGASVRYLFESIIAPWHALSRLPLWSKLFTAGLALEALGGIAFLVVVGLRHESIAPVVSLFASGSDWRLFGPLIIFLFVAFVVGKALDTLVARVLLYRSPSYAGLVVFASFLPIWRMLDSALTQHWLFSRWIADEFWRDVIGSEVRIPLGLALLSGFYVPFTFLRRQRHRQFASTAASFFSELTSFFVPVVVSVSCVMASRYALLSLGLSGTVPFIAASIVVSISLTWLLSLLLRRGN